tara:strand:- start:29 stop:1411 length:1383 start_codon:yes stop_codon:yes gene_type:complete
MSINNNYTLAEIFCGCGGFSHGFARSGRFSTLFGNDIKAAAIRSYAFNHQSDSIVPGTILQDIRQVPLSSIAEILKDRGCKPGELDCLVGGPPCQGFSQLRRSEERENGKIVKFRGYSKLAHDPRNDLVLRFLEVAEYLRPKFIVIENVPQMLSHGFEQRLGKLSETVVNVLEEMGYSVWVGVVSAADYGVPQLRERAIFIASSIGPVSMPEPSHADPSQAELLLSGRKPWRTVADAIKDLPQPPSDIDDMGGESISHYLPTRSRYAESLRSAQSFPFNHVTRSYRKSVLRIIEIMRAGQTWDAESSRIRSVYDEKIESYKEKHGCSKSIARSALEKQGVINPVFYKKYYWSAYTRLAWNLPALTITANANFLGSGRFTHPSEMRGITMREAARLQSFDDDFRFITSADRDDETSNIGVGLDMIGEAVPPLLAEAIANHLANQLDKRSASTRYNKIPIPA